jgi:hypothetical protein
MSWTFFLLSNSFSTTLLVPRQVADWLLSAKQLQTRLSSLRRTTKRVIADKKNTSNHEAL